MKALEDKIRNDGVIKKGNVLKVDCFLNHQIDVAFLEMIGQEFKRRFADSKITKILTVEASGIGVAVITAKYFDYVPVVFAKKSKTSNISDDVYYSSVYSYTHQQTYQMVVAKSYISENDHVLIIDDFLANGCAALGLIDLVKQAGGTIEGIGIVIEKGFQEGGRVMRENGYHLESLAIIESMDEKTGNIKFKERNE